MLGWNLYSIRNRSPMRWPLRNWNTGPMPDGVDKDLDDEEIVSNPTCPPSADKIEKCKQEAKSEYKQRSRKYTKKHAVC